MYQWSCFRVVGSCLSYLLHQALNLKGRLLHIHIKGLQTVLWKLGGPAYQCSRLWLLPFILMAAKAVFPITHGPKHVPYDDQTTQLKIMPSCVLRENFILFSLISNHVSFISNRNIPCVPYVFTVAVTKVIEPRSNFQDKSN